MSACLPWASRLPPPPALSSSPTWALARRLQPSLRWTLRLVDRRVLRQLCGFGAWNLLFTLAGLFLWWTDNIVIGRLLGPAAVPLYALPFMLITLGRVAVGGLSSPLAPLAAAQAREESRALAITLVRSTRIAVILTLASTGLLVVAAEDLFRLWIGPDYASGWLVYACLMASFWAVYAQMPASNILLGAGDIRRPAAVVLAATALALAVKIVALGWLGQGVIAVALANWSLCPAGDGILRAPLRLPAGTIVACAAVP